MSYRFADSLRAGSGRNCSSKHVEFYSKNKLEKLVHLAGFIIRIYHDARSPKRQKKCYRDSVHLFVHKIQKYGTHFNIMFYICNYHLHKTCPC